MLDADLKRSALGLPALSPVEARQGHSTPWASFTGSHSPSSGEPVENLGGQAFDEVKEWVDRSVACAGDDDELRSAQRITPDCPSSRCPERNLSAVRPLKRGGRTDMSGPEADNAADTADKITLMRSALACRRVWRRCRR